MESEPKGLSFLHSSPVAESPFFDNFDVLSWFRERRASEVFRVHPISFAAMSQWNFEPNTRNLVHDSGRFFRIEGLRVETNFESAGQWDQPIIN